MKLYRKYYYTFSEALDEYKPYFTSLLVALNIYNREKTSENASSVKASFILINELWNYSDSPLYRDRVVNEQYIADLAAKRYEEDDSVAEVIYYADIVNTFIDLMRRIEIRFLDKTFIITDKSEAELNEVPIRSHEYAVVFGYKFMQVVKRFSETYFKYFNLAKAKVNFSDVMKRGSLKVVNEADSDAKENLNDTPQASQTDKFDEKYANTTSRTRVNQNSESNTYDDTARYIDKLNDYASTFEYYYASWADIFEDIFGGEQLWDI